MVPRLWVKLHTSAELKSIRIVVPTVLGELRFGHTTSVSSRNGWVGVSCFGKVSGSCAVCYSGCRVLQRMRSPVANLKLGCYVDQPYVLLDVRKLL